MKLEFNKYHYFINEKNGLTLPILRGYEDAYKKEIAEIKKDDKRTFNVLDRNYNYENVFIAINITKNCNLACKYCFNKTKGNKKLSYETIVNFIDKIIEITPKAERYTIDLAGSGEPLLELDTILKVAEYCYNKSNEIKKYLMPQLVCNGTLLTKDVVEKLQKANVLFGVSIDGKKKVHDTNRVDRGGNGTFDTIINNIKAIENRSFVGAAVTISNNNIKILDDVKFLSKYFETISIKIARPEKDIPIDYLQINNEYDKLAIYLLKEFKKGKIDTLKRLLNGDDFFGKYLFRVIANASVASRCDAGLGKFSIDFDGNLYVCSGAVGISDLCLGTIDNIDQKKGRLLQDESSNNHTCESCKYRRICGGECLVVSKTQGCISKDMCAIKKHLIDLSLYIKGELLFEYNDLLDDIYKFIEEKIQRSFADKELTDLSIKNDNYTFMQLKELKDKNDPLYKELLNK